MRDPFNELMCGGHLLRLGDLAPPDAFAQFSYARIVEKHPGRDVPQAAARGVQNQTGTHIPADVGDALIVVGRYVRRQATARHDEFGRLCCHL